MLKRNRTLIVKFLVCFLGYYVITILLSSRTSLYQEKLVADSDNDNIAVTIVEESHNLVEDKDAKEEVLEPAPESNNVQPPAPVQKNAAESAQLDHEEGIKEARENVDEVVQEKIEADKEAEEQKVAILPPKNPEGPGEMGRPYRVDKNKVDEETKKRIEKGWENNAYNEYVSDLISVHRWITWVTYDIALWRVKFLYWSLTILMTIYILMKIFIVI